MSFKYKSNRILLLSVVHPNPPHESLSNYGAIACQGLAPLHYPPARGSLLLAGSESFSSNAGIEDLLPKPPLSQLT